MFCPFLTHVDSIGELHPKECIEILCAMWNYDKKCCVFREHIPKKKITVAMKEEEIEKE